MSEFALELNRAKRSDLPSMFYLRANFANCRRIKGDRDQNRNIQVKMYIGFKSLSPFVLVQLAKFALRKNASMANRYV